MSRIRSNRYLRQTCIYRIAQAVPSPYEKWKGHTYAVYIHVSEGAYRCLHLNIFCRFPRSQSNQKKTLIHVFLIMIGQAMDFSLGGISLPAIHSKTFAKLLQTSAMKTCFQIVECSLAYAKVRKRIGMSKKIKKFLVHPTDII